MLTFCTTYGNFCENGEIGPKWPELVQKRNKSGTFGRSQAWRNAAKSALDRTSDMCRGENGGNGRIAGRIARLGTKKGA